LRRRRLASRTTIQRPSSEAPQKIPASGCHWEFVGACQSQIASPDFLSTASRWLFCRVRQHFFCQFGSADHSAIQPIGNDNLRTQRAPERNGPSLQGPIRAGLFRGCAAHREKKATIVGDFDSQRLVMRHHPLAPFIAPVDDGLRLPRFSPSLQ
jgi:hypothetical protein